MSQMEEMKAVRERLWAIERLLEELKKAEAVLANVNAYVTAGKVWRPQLCVKARGGYYDNDEVNITVTIPSGVIQQAAINDVVRIKRELNLLGYEWPAPQKVKK